MRTPSTLAADSRDRSLVIGAATLTVAVLTGLAGYVYYVQREYEQMLHGDLRIEELAGDIKHLDELLTMSARLCAASGDQIWEERYHRHVDTLDQAIKEAATLVPDASAREFTAQTDVANQKLVAMEVRSFELVRSQRKDEAFHLLMSSEYAAQKEIYAAGIETLIEEMKRRTEEARRRHDLRSNVAVAASGLATLLLALVWIQVIRSVNQYRAARAQADQEQKRLVAILEASPDFIGYANPNMQIQFINRAGRAMVGIGATQDIAGLTIPDVHPTWFLKQMQEQMRVGLPQDHWVVDGAFKDRAGAEIPISMVLIAHRGEDGGVAYYSTISRDMTERKRADEERQKLVALVENSDEFIGLAGLDEKITFLNSAACRLVGLDPGEMTSKALWDFVHPDAVVQARNVALPSFQSAGVWHGETSFRHFRTGAAIPVEMSAFVVQHPQTHQPLCLATVAHDITGRKQNEANVAALNADLKRHAAELETALAESQEFAYAAAHNLRSPLRGIDGFCQVVLEEEGERLSPDARQHLERVRHASHTMASLVDELLRLSRLIRMKMDRHATDLSALARAIADDLRQREPDRQVEFVIPDGLVAECDGPLARILLKELLENAWKFTTAHPQARIEFGAMKQPDQTLAFFVRDDGVGFDMAYADKLFVPFQHLHTPGEFTGTGIGLATVQRIVRRHGGRVWAEGQVGRGATFYFTL